MTILAPQLLAPLNDDSPCGQDPRRLEAFIELREEATRGEGLCDTRPEWNKVAALATTLLETHTKDLRVAVYLSLAWMHTQGLQGLARGLLLLHALLDTYPRALHPQARKGRLLGRTRSLEWMCERAVGWLGIQDPLAWDAESLEQSKLGVKQLLELSPDALPDAALGLGQLKRALDKGRGRPAAPCLPPSNPQEPTTIPSQTSWQWPKEPQLQTQAIDACKDRQKRIAVALREQDPKNPLAYRWLRQALWNQVDSLHPSAAGTLLVSLPSPKARQSLEDHLRHQRWPGLLESSEENFLRHPFCLDLQRYSVLALEAMGGATLAIRSIHSQLSALLQLLPDLRESTDSQGQPVAHQDTRAWLDAEFAASSATHIPNEASQADSPTDPWWATLQEVPPTEHSSLVNSIQSALRDAPDRVQYARRCLRIAAHYQSVPGLHLTLSTLAYHSLIEPSHESLDHSLESQALQTLLHHQAGPGAAAIPALRCETTASLALQLARRDLRAALPYYIQARA